mmetsp:Transcript_3296/g.11603  ORF Transcript_3296/g.11603 Transcript_3296/m.11603 type:complete len:245 (+) Transcript_3296:81-815(+)
MALKPQRAHFSGRAVNFEALVGRGHDSLQASHRSTGTLRAPRRYSCMAPPQPPQALVNPDASSTSPAWPPPPPAPPPCPPPPPPPAAGPLPLRSRSRMASSSLATSATTSSKHFRIVTSESRRTSAFLLVPSAIFDTSASSAARSSGRFSRWPIASYASTSAEPSGVGRKTWLSLMAYSRVRTVLMCSAIVASVPMPCVSILAKRSDSVRPLGGLVSPALSSIFEGSKRSSWRIIGSALVFHRS